MPSSPPPTVPAPRRRPAARPAPVTGGSTAAAWTEADRLAALHDYAILDTLPEQDFDDLARMAAALLDAPIAAVNLIAETRQWFKAEVGMGVREMPLDNSICARMILESGELVVPDLLRDPRFDGNPLVTAGPGLRFYAGELLQTPEGLPLGTLCVLDTRSRPQGLSGQQRFVLKTLARQVMNQLNLRRSLARQERLQAEQARAEVHRRQILDSATDFAIITTDLARHVTGWNSGAANILGWTEAGMLGRSLDVIFVAEDRAAGLPEAETQRAAQAGQAADERWHQKHDGSRFWASGEMMPLRDERGRHTGYLKLLRDRTEQHLAGQALEAVNERFRLAQQATRDAIWDWNLQDDIVQWNEALQEAYGWAPAQVAPGGAWWLAQIHPEDQDRIGQGIHAVLEGGKAGWTGEYRFRRADGSYAEVLDRGSVIRGPDGRALRMIGAMLDISARKRAEEALRDSEARYRNLFDSLDDGLCVIEFIDGPHGPLSDYVHVEANPGYERHTGIPDIVGRTLRGLAPDEAEGWLALYGHVLRTGEPLRFERDFIAAGRPIEVSAVRVEPASRQQVSVLFRDVTARKQAEAALRASEALAQESIQRVQLALEAGAIIGTWAWDLPADCFTVDEAFAQAFSLDPALGRSGISLETVIATVHPDDKPGLLEAIREGIRRGGGYAHQYRVRRADGRYRWIEANGRVHHAADGTPTSFPGVLIDVQERRTVEAERDRAAAALRALNETLEQRVTERTAELLRAEEQLRQSQKMEAVGQLTGGLAHDFNNLLTGISGSLELLEIRVAQGRLGDLGRYVSAAQSSAKRASALTHRLLAFSRRQTLDPKPTDVNRLIAGMVELIRRTAGPEIMVETIEAADLWPTLVDPPQLENALLNLCINARDAMPGGGRIGIETVNTWLDARQAAERDLPAGPYLCLSVTDTGAGMTPDVLARAFDPFFTTKPIGQGTGLGLSMIYGFVRQSGGQVHIASEPGRGTAMRLYLPRHHGDAAEPERPPDLAGAPRATVGETVLVVDDEAVVRMLVTEVLQELGYAAVEAADGPSGLKVLQSDLRIDLLVSDVGLPGGMNGRQLADAARMLRPGLKILFITGYAENAAVGHDNLEPGMHVMTKPFAMEALASRIKELIAG